MESQIETSVLLVSKSAAAQMLGVSQRTVENLISRCELPCVRIGRRCLLSRKTLEDFVRRNAGLQIRSEVQ